MMMIMIMKNIFLLVCLLAASIVSADDQLVAKNNKSVEQRQLRTGMQPAGPSKPEYYYYESSKGKGSESGYSSKGKV